MLKLQIKSLAINAKAYRETVYSLQMKKCTGITNESILPKSCKRKNNTSMEIEFSHEIAFEEQNIED